MIRVRRKPKTPVPEGLTVYEAKKGWQVLNLRELWKYRELLYFLAWRDVKVRYKQAVLGIGWVIIQPLLTMVVFTFVFNRLLNVSSSDEALPYEVFSLSGLVIWQYFSGSVTRAGQSLVQNANLLTKVYFPRLAVPMSSVLSGLVDLVIALVILFIMMAGFGIAPSWEVFFLPLLIILTMLTALAVGVWLSALNVLYRDVNHLIPFVVQLWMFVSPVIYDISTVNIAAVKVLFSLNPMTGVINGFRWALLGQPFETQYFWYSVLIVVVLLVAGLFNFRRMERVFADVI